MDKIEGGYYIKARKLRNSDIAKKPPHFREIWDWLIEQANYSTNGKVPRGSCIRSIKDIQEGLVWYVGFRKQKYSITQCENATKWLRNAEMITTMRAEGGTLIKVDNYDLYQDVKNYESRMKADMKAERKLNESRTASQDSNKNDSSRVAKEGVKKGTKEKKRSEKKYQFSELHLSLTDLLITLIKQNKPDRILTGNNYRKEWANDMRLTNEKDKRSIDRIREVIEFSQRDSFWKQNILSVGKLRKHFDELEMRMIEEEKKGGPTFRPPCEE